MASAMKHRKSVTASLFGVVAFGLAAVAVWFLLQPRTPEDLLGAVAEDYVRLATALTVVDADEVDNYFGPPSLDSRTADRFQDPAELRREVETLSNQLEALDLPTLVSRKDSLERKLTHLLTLLEITQAPVKPGFDEELERLYGITEAIATTTSQADLDALEELLPGRGTLAFRVASFRNRLLIPADKRRAVFEAALAECKRRTQQHWDLPANEQLTLQWSREVPAAWHQYKGDGQSVLTINDLSIAFMDSAIDIACHEGYPGHHAQYVMMEEQLKIGPSGVEDTVVLLRSAESAVLEGAANYGVTLAFTPQERDRFERDVLAPLAGINLPEETQLIEYKRLIGRLSEAILPIVKQYYDGEIAFNTATFQLERDAMVSSPSALLEYIDRFGMYSIGYTYGQTQISNRLETTAAVDRHAAWTGLLTLVRSPAMAATDLFR
jgi:hypothetical protein